MEVLLQAMPQEAAALCRRLAQETPAAPAELLEITRCYLAVVEAAAGTNEFLDLPTARAIASALELALAEPTPTHPDHLAALHVAVRYFEEDDDGDPDLESVLGFDDDAQVLNAVLRYIGREDLCIELP
jgi:hypothetical protein